MSLARTALRGAVRAPFASGSPAARRLASSSAHDEHHHDEHHDDTVYRPEGFHSRGWIYTILAFGGVALFYKYAPAPGDENSRITRWIKSWAPGIDWKARNDNHLALITDQQEAKLVMDSARRPPMYRMRYAQHAQMATPFSVPVGMEVDFSDVKPKGDYDY